MQADQLRFLNITFRGEDSQKQPVGSKRTEELSQTVPNSRQQPQGDLMVEGLEDPPAEVPSPVLGCAGVLGSRVDLVEERPSDRRRFVLVGERWEVFEGKRGHAPCLPEEGLEVREGDERQDRGRLLSHK
jgi:hypothetical protein